MTDVAVKNSPATELDNAATEPADESVSGTQLNLTMEDTQAITTEIAETDGVAPVVGGSVQVKHANKNARVSLVGTDVPEQFRVGPDVAREAVTLDRW